MNTLSFTAPIRIWNNGTAPASRHFITVPTDIADQIKNLQVGQNKRGWGAVKVSARIGRISRETSLFPDKQSQSYLLPIKAMIRKQLGIQQGDTLGIVLKLL